MFKEPKKLAELQLRIVETFVVISTLGIKKNDAILKLFGVILGTDVLVSWFWPVEMCQYKARKKFKFASVESPLTFVGKIPKTSEFWANISCLRATIELEKVT